MGVVIAVNLFAQTMLWEGEKKEAQNFPLNFIANICMNAEKPTCALVFTLKCLHDLQSTFFHIFVFFWQKSLTLHMVLPLQLKCLQFEKSYLSSLSNKSHVHGISL